jgi:hypothetical protein
MAVFAFAWAVVRARMQSVVGDEATTYLEYLLRDLQWYPAASNHLLNTLLMKLFIAIFGLSPMTLRAGPLIAAAIYISSAYWLCRMLSREWIVRIPLFTCLVYNPYVFDYFVAARGYGLGLAFLLFAITVGAWSHLESRPILGCGLASLSVGLAFTANFSFAFAGASLIALLFAWHLRTVGLSGREPWRLLAASIGPGLLVTLLIPSSMLLNWQKGGIVAGTESLSKMFGEMIKATLDQPNPAIVNPSLYGIVARVEHQLLEAFWLAALLQLAVVLVGWRSFQKPENRWRLGLTMVAGGAAGLALLMHWIAFRTFGLLLPVNRTSVFFAPLITVMVGAAVSIPVGSRLAGWIRRAAITMVCVMGSYFVLCLRLSYFHEWRYIAEARDAYFVAAYYNHTRCAQRVFATWYFDAALEFYRRLYTHERFTSFTEQKDIVDPQLYVLNAAFDREMIDSKNLTEVYHGKMTDVGVYLAPSIATPPEKVCDAALLP